MDEYPVPVSEALVREIADKIVEHFDPEKVILFGSHSTGTARADSDIDLLVIMDTDASSIQRAIEVKKVCRPRFVSMDVLVKTPAEVETTLERGSFFLDQILDQGRVLYERQS
jgi:predicted nucleotidyltransferase